MEIDHQSNIVMMAKCPTCKLEALVFCRECNSYFGFTPLIKNGDSENQISAFGCRCGHIIKDNLCECKTVVPAGEFQPSFEFTRFFESEKKEQKQGLLGRLKRFISSF